MVEDAANHLFEQAHQDLFIPHPKVGALWTKHFVDRYPLYLRHKQKLLSAEKDNAQDIDSIKKMF